MRIASSIIAALGIVLLIMALVGRLFGPSIVYLLGDSFASMTLLVASNTAFLLAILLRMISMEGK